jgi:hypothetical protein
MSLSNALYYVICLSAIAGRVTVPDVAGSQVNKRSDNVVVNGRSGQANVVIIDNREYIDVRALAGIAQGSVEFQGSRIIFTIPESSANTSPQEEPEQKSTAGLSQEFVKAGIEEIALMREWATSLAYAVQNGYPISEQAANQYKGQAASGLKVVQAAAKTEADRNAFQLLNNEFAAVEQWSNKLMEAQKSMDTGKYAVSDSALREDPLSQKIIACGHFLGSMLGSRTFQDDASCH